MFDLNALPARYLAMYGLNKVAEVVGKSTSIVAMWQKRSKFPLEAVSRLLEFDPSPLNEIQPTYTVPPLGKKLCILVPLSTPPAPKMMDSLMYLHDPREMGYERFGFNCLSVTRNVLAARAYRGEYDWTYWQDADTMVPCGMADWYKEQAEVPDMPDCFARLHTIYSLISHKVKWGRPEATIVSCSYVGRKKGAPPQFGGGNLPEMRNLVKRGPQNKLIEVPWVGFGGVVVHRSVFTDIIKTQGDEIRMKPGGVGTKFKNDEYEYGFFNPISGEQPTDDVPFCVRARKAGHRIFVDLSIQAAHVGDRPFTYKDL